MVTRPQLARLQARIDEIVSSLSGGDRLVMCDADETPEEALARDRSELGAEARRSTPILIYSGVPRGDA